jgi:hypothetical protein
LRRRQRMPEGPSALEDRGGDEVAFGFGHRSPLVSTPFAQHSNRREEHP